MNYKKLINQAINVQQNAYAPYSKFKVGAALLCEDGTVVTACNIENGAYPIGNCAEKNAFERAISMGQRNFVAIAIVGGDLSKYCYPCGACRQIMTEFNPQLDVVVAKSENEYKVHKAFELLPHYFELKGE